MNIFILILKKYAEKNFISENDRLVNWYIKKYEILEIQLFLSINININDYKNYIHLKILLIQYSLIR